MSVTIAMPRMSADPELTTAQSKYVESLARAGASVRWVELADPDKAVAVALECAGLLLPGDPIPTAPAVLSGVQRRPLSEFQARLPVGYKRRVLRLPQRQIVTGTLTIREGRKHQVRRMLGACGCQIFYLKRTAIGGVTLDATLAPGQLRPLTGAERILLGVTADREESL